MQLTNILVLAGVLGASAMPSGHAHLHRSAHQARELKFYKAEKHIIKPVAVTSTSSSVAVPSSTVAAEPVKSSAPAVVEEEDPNHTDEYIPFCGENKNTKRVTYAQVMYTGNTGDANGCKWNSNMMTIPKKIADKYNNRMFYTNVADVPYQVVCANKMGSDHGLNGMFKVASNQQLVFTLQPGETQVVVAAANTQGVCAFAPEEVPTTSAGQYAGNWAEFDFENSSNGGWSGADCSSLVAQAYDMDVPGCQICGHGTCSTILPGGFGDNAYTKGMEAEDGIGLNINKDQQVTLNIKVGYNKGL
ncbi:hypothetical protein B0T20DRAFT_418510 [Sordaria brevicollis]|uniref:Allergen Asp f 4 n=1 Tax=Sordaria brevicollis TaxID=83679 RepID=A0AAE0U9B3_SORBR|nr:hypothetical protein B0T20DRAFT_418510 [Sordaria brevicollis]